MWDELEDHEKEGLGLIVIGLLLCYTILGIVTSFASVSALFGGMIGVAAVVLGFDRCSGEW